MSPRPTQATGRPGAPVIPHNWEAGHAAVVAGSLRGRVALSDPDAVSSREWSDELEQWVTTPAGPYATNVPARVQRLNGQALDVVTADDDETVVDHLVVVQWGLSEVQPGHLVTVTVTTDPALKDLVLRVHTVGLGTERFERDLFCTLT